MKEVAEYIGHKVSYGAEIQRSLDKYMNTGVAYTTRQTRNGYVR